MEAYVAAADLQGVADMYRAMTTRGIQPDICTFVALFKVALPAPHASSFGSAAYHVLPCESGAPHASVAYVWPAALPGVARLVC